MKNFTITSNRIRADYLTTICWTGNDLVDWARGGKKYIGEEAKKLMELSYPYAFDAAISSSSGKYAFIYKKNATKGLLLKDGELLREINRSYYFASTYDYPAAFVTLADGKTYLVHCPISYRQLDFEDVETGELVTNIDERQPKDTFHSRLTISPDGKYLVSSGWHWHPWDIVITYNIEACIKNPLLLDRDSAILDGNVEICTASFIDDSNLLIGSSTEDQMDDELPEVMPPGGIAIWNIFEKRLSKPVKVSVPFGNLIAINSTYAWDLYKHPKIININTGEVEQEFPDISTGEQRSSIIGSASDKISPITAFNKQTLQLAIAREPTIEVLSFQMI